MNTIITFLSTLLNIAPFQVEAWLTCYLDYNPKSKALFAVLEDKYKDAPSWKQQAIHDQAQAIWVRNQCIPGMPGADLDEGHQAQVTIEVATQQELFETGDAPVTVVEIDMALSMAQLKGLCRDSGITGYSKYTRKATLRTYIQQQQAIQDKQHQDELNTARKGASF